MLKRLCPNAKICMTNEQTDGQTDGQTQSKCQIFPDIVFFRAFCAQTTMSKCRGFDDKQTNKRMDEQTNSSSSSSK